MVRRSPWGKFPSVIAHTTRRAVEEHPDFAKASRGDLKAAQRLVRELAQPPRWSVSVQYVCATHQLKDRWSAIPVAFAELVAEQTGATVVSSILREKPPNAFPTNSTDRLLNQSGYDGNVPKGSYLICGDICMWGSTFGNLRGHIEHQGGHVVAATSLAADVFSTALIPDPNVLVGLRARFGNELSFVRAQLGFDDDRLTAREAYFLYGLKTLDVLRNRASA